MIEQTQSAVGAAAYGVGGAAVVAPAILGVEAAVLLAACAGALFGLRYTDPDVWQRLLTPTEGPRWRRALGFCGRAAGLLFTVIATAYGCAWGVQILPHVELLGTSPFAWMLKVPPVPMAGGFSFIGLWLIPRAMEKAELRWLSRSKP